METPRIDPESLPPVTRRRRVGGVLLAAGLSRRFGDRNKLLEPVPNSETPIVRRAAETLVAAGLNPIVVVVGHESERVWDAVSGLDVRTTRAETFASGQAASLAAGIEAIDGDRGGAGSLGSEISARPPEAAIVALSDMPFVSPTTIRTLRRAYGADVGTVIAPTFDGKRGNPVLFDREWFDDLTAIEGDVGGRAIVRKHGVLVSVDDPGVLRDVDEPGDLP